MGGRRARRTAPGLPAARDPRCRSCRGRLVSPKARGGLRGLDAATCGTGGVITGAGRGFGRAIATKLAAEGASVALLARSQQQVEEAAAAITATGGRAIAVATDVSDPAQVARACSASHEAFGPATLLVSNAGVPGPFGPVWELDADKWWRAEAIHIRAPLLLMRNLMPDMVARRKGRVIVISAVATASRYRSCRPTAWAKRRSTSWWRWRRRKPRRTTCRCLRSSLDSSSRSSARTPTTTRTRAATCHTC